MSEKRKLAAVMFTDIVAYTALMSQDEQKALQILEKNRTLQKDLAKKHSGEFLKEMGDGTLLCFQSALDAVRCAMAIQESVKDDPDHNLRIGIHLGDIVFKAGDVFGDGVNVASRIERLADAGGICVSEQIRILLRNQPEINAEFIGEKTLKNIDNAVRIYSLSEKGFKSPQCSKRAVSGSVIQHPVVKQKRIHWRINIPMLAITAVIFSIAAWLLKPQPEPESISFFTHSPLPGETLSNVGLAISPDGTKIVYGATTAGITKLYLRQIDQLEASQIDHTKNALNPFFSPDGRELCFFADDKLKKILIDEGTVQTLCDVLASPHLVPSGTWGDDGTIIFTGHGSGLFRIPASGGLPEVILPLDPGKTPIYYRFPEMLPGSEAVLYATWEGGIYDEAHISVLSLETGEIETLITGGTNPLYSPTGHILFGRSSTCWAVPFDKGQLKITGQEIPVQEGIYITPGIFGGAAHFRVSETGTLVYIPGSEAEEDRTLVLVDRHGVETPLTDIHRAYGYPRFSPDGRRVALDILEDHITNIWIYDVARNTQMPWTSSEGSLNRFPRWSPDGKKMTFQSNRSGVNNNIYWKRVDGIGEAELLFGSTMAQFGGTWSEDGLVFAFTEISPTRREDIWVYTTRDSTAEPFLNTPNREYSPAISADGNWIAYISDKTGQSQVYIAPYPGPGNEEPISTQGGEQVVWAPDGSELFYRKDNKVMAVSVETRPSLKLGMPELLFEKPYPYYESNSNITSYDIHPDGDHFLMVKSVENDDEFVRDQINIVLNWFEVLKEKMTLAQKSFGKGKNDR